MEKKRKITVIVCVILAIIILLAAAIVTIYFVLRDGLSNKIDKYLKKYGMEEILCVADTNHLYGFTVDGEYWGKDNYADKKEGWSYTYLVGTKDGNEAALIFENRSGAAYESKWIFDTSFSEICQRINSLIGKKALPLGTSYHLIIYDTLHNADTISQLVPELDQQSLDVPVVLRVSYSNTEDYAIVQSNGGILIFNVEHSSN